MDNGFVDIPSPLPVTAWCRPTRRPNRPCWGRCLIDPDAVIRIAAFLKADDFYQEKNGWIYQAILDLHERREPADFLTVTDELDRRRQLDEVGGPAYVMDLLNAVPTAIHVEHYARIVERTSVLRKLIRAAGQIAQIAYEETTEDIGEVVDRAEQIIFTVAERRAQRDLVVGAGADGRRRRPHRLSLPPPGRDPGRAHRLQAAGQDAGRPAEERFDHSGRQAGRW